jgi:hypothetical protein
MVSPSLLGRLVVLAAVAAGRKRGALRPHARAVARSGRVVDYGVIKSKPRQPTDRHNCGGDRSPPVALEAQWIEVSHTRDDAWTAPSLWMYAARPGATGVFYDAGRALAAADTVDLAAYLNATYYDPRDYASKLRLFAEAPQRLPGINTVVFTSHLDACCDRRLVEVVALARADAACPATAAFRSGPNRTRCPCATPLAVC